MERKNSDVDLIEKTDDIIEKHKADLSELIPILLEIQEELKWIPEESMKRISKRIEISKTRVYRIASFYKGLMLEPMGDHLVQVCLGTACSTRGAEKIFEETQKTLGIEGEGTSPDLKFTLQSANCLGCCGMGPVMAVDGNYHGNLTTGEVKEILESYE